MNPQATSTDNDGWRPMRRWEKAVAATVGTLALAWAGVLGYRTLQLVTHGQRAEGQVIANTGHPRIRFTTTTGATVEFVQNGFVTRDAGSPIGVVYDPSNPAGTARADTFLALWGLSLWPLPMGLGALAAVFLGGQIKYRGPFVR